MAYEVARSRVFEYNRYSDQISSQFIDRLESDLAVSQKDFESAINVRDRAVRILEILFVDCEVILSPTAPCEVPVGLDAPGVSLFSRGWNLLQVPSVSISFGKGPNGWEGPIATGSKVGASADAEYRLKGKLLEICRS